MQAGIRRILMEDIPMKKKPVLYIRAVMFVGLAFVTGWTASLWANNNGINSGLVNALNSVGQNLFGETVFGAGIINPDVMPTVQLDLLDASPNPVVLNVFRGDTCQTYAQVRVGPGGTRMIIDPDVIPYTSLVLDDLDLSAFPPGPCHPPDPILPPGGDV
jgi:hypothetical protein